MPALDLKTLSQRLAVMDGWLPADDLLEAAVQHRESQASAVLWKRVSLGLGAAFVATIIMFLCLYNSASAAMVLLKDYQGRCLDSKTAEVVVHQSEQMMAVNTECIALHKNNQDFYEALAAIYTPTSPSTKAPVMATKVSSALFLHSAVGGSAWGSGVKSEEEAMPEVRP